MVVNIIYMKMALLFISRMVVLITQAHLLSVWAANLIGRTPQAFTEWLKEAFKAGAKRGEIERVANANNLHKYVINWEELVFAEVQK